MTANEDASVRYRIGGLMRCCTETVHLDLHAAGTPAEGDKLQCRYSDSDLHRMRFRDGAWEWDR